MTSAVAHNRQGGRSREGAVDVARPTAVAIRAGRLAIAGARRGMHALVDLVLPPSCLGCRAPIAPGDGLCAVCWPELEFIEAPLCDISGLPFVFDPGAGMISAAALARPPVAARMRAAVRYGDVSRRMVHGLKYRDRMEFADTIARLTARAGRELLGDAQLIVPVPLHRGRLWQRRYNQSAIVAQRLGAACALPVDLHNLRRNRRTRAQVGLKMAERRRNVRRAFTVADDSGDAFAGLNIVLVDDVITTGATLDACADALYAHGAARVDALAFAMVCEPVSPGS